jgi:hypothetical protein
VPVGNVPVEHSFVVHCLLSDGPDARPVRNRLTVGSDRSPAGIGRTLAAHLGASRIEMVSA